MKKFFVAIILMFSTHTAQAVTHEQQKLLYMTMHSSILLAACSYPDAAWELTDVARTLGRKAGYSDLQLAQLHKKIEAEVAYIFQLQGGMKHNDCDMAVNFHTYVMRLQGQQFPQQYAPATSHRWGRGDYGYRTLPE